MIIFGLKAALETSSRAYYSSSLTHATQFALSESYSRALLKSIHTQSRDQDSWTLFGGLLRKVSREE